jgi:hypothetical protein
MLAENASAQYFTYNPLRYPQECEAMSQEKLKPILLELRNRHNTFYGDDWPEWCFMALTSAW